MGFFSGVRDTLFTGLVVVAGVKTVIVSAPLLGIGAIGLGCHRLLSIHVGKTVKNKLNTYERALPETKNKMFLTQVITTATGAEINHVTSHH